MLAALKQTPKFDLLTIGHSNHPIEQFMTLLLGAGVTAIGDVRSRPVSRRYPWFSKARLTGTLDAQSIAYRFFGDALGGRPADPLLFTDGIADYEAMARMPVFRAGIEAVREEAGRSRLCLMCAEREPLDCHRCLLIAPALAARGMKIGHILADGTVEPHQATERRLVAALGGGDLFQNDAALRLAEAYRRRARAVAFRAKS